MTESIHIDHPKAPIPTVGDLRCSCYPIPPSLFDRCIVCGLPVKEGYERPRDEYGRTLR